MKDFFDVPTPTALKVSFYHEFPACDIKRGRFFDNCLLPFHVK